MKTIRDFISFFSSPKIHPIIIKGDNKLTTSEMDSFSFFNSEKSERTLNLLDNTYYKLTQNIRNLQPLSKDEIDFIQTLSKENLIEIILIYNADIDLIHKVYIQP